ncbi:MAG: 4Fe-4S binding protein [Oscillospiraceae bacterium]|jgi:2-oxoglutarate ferredoxin oxidoreductase subunit delta|nr:4Fe-4S binding protein [Oscillospiraceae bacterium]
MAKFLVKFNEDKCKGCELCATFCPKRIIAMSKTVNAKGYSVATMQDQEKCIGCTNCAIMCPDGAIEVFKMEEEDK